jgi:hypothetical protein
MKHSKKHKRKTQTEIHALLNLQEKQDTTVAAFCTAHKIKIATFYKWRERYHSKPTGQEAFVPVQLADPVTKVSILFAEIDLPSKVSIRLFQKVDVVYFKSLLKS